MAELNEQKQAEIQKQAMGILESFGKSLAKTSLKKKEFKKQIGGFREQKSEVNKNEDFRKIMFENAPLKSGDFIIAEKKSW